jgi:hypothetical protein
MRTITNKDMAAFSAAIEEWRQEGERLGRVTASAEQMAARLRDEIDQRDTTADCEALAQTQTQIVVADIERMKRLEKHIQHCFGMVRPVFETPIGFMGRFQKMSALETMAEMHKNGIRLVAR